jgi:hypothetical protein
VNVEGNVSVVAEPDSWELPEHDFGIVDIDYQSQRDFEDDDCGDSCKL